MRIRLAAAAVAALSLLTACGSGSGSAPNPTASAAAIPASKALASLTATGPVDFKTAPKVTLPKTPLTTTDVERKVLTPGSGAAATKDSTVRFRAMIYNGTDGKVLQDGYKPEVPVLGFRLGQPDLMAGIKEGLVGAQKGSRFAFTIPAAKGFGANGNEQLGVKGTDTMLFVADIVDVHTGLTKIEGTQTAAPADLPTVTFPNGPTKEPKVTIPKNAAPTATKQATLIEGTGPVVEKGQTLVAHYHGLLWKDGSMFDSSWQRGSAADFPIGVGKVIPGWDNTLVGKKIGSRVLLVIPPADGYGKAGSPPKIAGTDTLVFVVDILDAY